MTTDGSPVRSRWKGKPWAEQAPAERRRNMIAGGVGLLVLCGACGLFGQYAVREGGKIQAGETATAEAMPTETARPTATVAPTTDPAAVGATQTAQINDVATTRAHSTETAAAPTRTPEPAVDRESFNRVETGMACQDLPAILGDGFEVLSESEVMGIKSVMLVWKAGIMSNVTIMCQNGKVVSKAQLGLK